MVSVEYPLKFWCHVLTPLIMQLQGPPRFELDGHEIRTFNTRKDAALLAYLATTARAHSREHLAGLLWTELPEDNARRNLRHTLTHLRKLLGPQWIQSGATVALNPALPWSVDVHELRRLVQSSQPPAPPQATATSDQRNAQADLGSLPQILTLIRGEFLDDFHVTNALHFDAWLTMQRAEWHRICMRGLETLAAHALSAGRYELGISAAQRQLELEPSCESGHRHMMRLLAITDRRTEALRQFQICREILAEELAVDPAPETVALHDRIQAGVAPQALLSRQMPSSQAGGRPDAGVQTPHEPPPRVPNNLATPLAGFVGREQELAFIGERLAADNCRLFTIVGPGGIGKTSLALAAGRQLCRTHVTEFGDGILWVSLHENSRAAGEEWACAPADETSAGDTLLQAIVEQINTHLAVNLSTRRQLAAYLRTRRLLLILDNFEHLLGSSAALAALLSHAPDVKALVTSRVRLNVRGEQTLWLDGLPVPPRGRGSADAAQSTEPLNPKTIGRESAAVAMFEQRARQSTGTFKLDEDTVDAVAAICHLVDGLPLGIELVAGMMPQSDCHELVRTLAAGMEHIAAELRDLPADKRTLAGVFAGSWQRLSPDMQTLAADLAVFPASFDIHAAAHIVAASHQALETLADQSLLQRTGVDRYAFHHVVHFFVDRELQRRPDDLKMHRRNHARYYLGMAAALETKLVSAEVKSAAAQLQQEMKNVLAAWAAALEGRMYADLGRSFHTLMIFFEPRIIQNELVSLCEQVLATFGHPQHRALGQEDEASNRLIGLAEGY
ncbi:MAG: BTAD domain-containing putative transcriptional regulator [Caldilineaceae bacterium]